MNRQEFVTDLTSLLRELQPTIRDDCRCSDYADDSEPGILVTIGADANGWNYQTGDNSFTGGAYSYADWTIVYLCRDSDCAALARDAAGDLDEVRADDAPIFDDSQEGFMPKLEAVRLRRAHQFIVRPAGACGTIGWSPAPWQAVYVRACNEDEAIRKAGTLVFYGKAISGADDEPIFDDQEG